jgi:MFS family permease
VAADVTDRRFRLASPATANVLAILGVALFLAVLPLAVVTRNLTGSSVGASLPMIVPFGGAGLVVARRQPRNPVGWILLGFAVLLVAGDCAGAYAALIYRSGHRALPLGRAAVLLDLLWAPAIVLCGLVALLYPDGTVPSAGWRWVLRAYLVVGACWPLCIYAVAIATIAGDRIRVDAGGNLTAIAQPAGSAAWLIPAQELLLPILAVFWLSFVGRQAATFRRSSDERRQQLKWLLSGAVAALFGAAVVVLVSSLDTRPSPIAEAAITLGAVVTIAFPVSIGVGILKYRLYDIDRIISRTLAYAIVTGLLVGIYAGLVLLATLVLTIRTPVAVAAATLAAAALFNPLRRRVQRMVDRRFNRTRYDGDQVIAAFAARLQDAVDIDTVRAALIGAAYQALEPEHASVWVGQHGPR